MTDSHVRIDAGNGRAATIAGALYESLPKDDRPALLDEPALDSRGLPRQSTRIDGRPDKPRTSVAKESAKKGDSTTRSGVAADPKEK